MISTLNQVHLIGQVEQLGSIVESKYAEKFVPKFRFGPSKESSCLKKDHKPFKSSYINFGATIEVALGYFLKYLL